MNTPTVEAQIAAASAYEALFVPALFGQWASKVADAAQIQPGQQVLDVACGTGILAREVAVRTGPTGSVAGLDPNAGMLAVAAQLGPTIVWQQGVAEALPFLDQAFNAVVCQFGLMFFTDRRQALHEMLRVVVPAGRVVVAVWDVLEHIPAYAAEVALLEHVAGRRAAEAVRMPFVLGDRQQLAMLCSDAGVASVDITTHHGTAEFPSIRVMIEADLRGWLPVMGVELAEDHIQQILVDAEQALHPYVNATGGITFDAPAHIVTGTTS